MFYLFLGIFALFVVDVGSAYSADDAPYQELPHIQSKRPTAPYLILG
jgi:hypothetical protein